MSLITDYSSSNSQPHQRQHLSPYNNTEANKAMMVEEAEKLYNKIVKDCINKTVQELKVTNEASDSKSSSLSLLSDVQKAGTTDCTFTRNSGGGGGGQGGSGSGGSAPIVTGPH